MVEDFSPQLLTLDLGLDLTTPKPAAAPGSLLSCVNYERGSLSGLTRIDGYEPYDGQTVVETSSFKILDLSIPHGLVEGDQVGVTEVYYGQASVVLPGIKHDATEFLAQEKEVGSPDGIFIHSAAVYGVIPGEGVTRTIHIGTVVGVASDTRIAIAVVNQDSLFVGASLLGLDVPTGNHFSVGTVVNMYDLNDIVYDVNANYTHRRDYATQLREEITSIPDPSGIVWYNNVLYAVGSKTDVNVATVGTLYRCRTIQQLLDDNSGAPKVIGWEELDLGTSLQTFPTIGATTAVNSLPIARGLELAQSQYEFLVANFYGSEVTTSLYGVSGASKAFVWNGSTFKFIETGLPYDLDKPRHIAKFADRLFLAYPNGSLMCSIVGDPLNFDGVLGAAEIGFGDKIVGLQVLAGEALAVFCENSIYYLDKDLGMHVISPNTGAIEYTIAATDRPFYCSANGIMTLEQTDKYGEFAGEPLSHKVNPWLRPRLKRIQGKQFSHPSVIGCMIVRTKNQYRLFFRDGYILTMTVSENGYVFTTQKYNFKDPGSDAVGDFLVFATSSSMIEDGTERLFACHRNPKLPFDADQVFELDVGWGFQGRAIEHHFETNAVTSATPFSYSRITKARLHGQSKGLTSLKIQTSGTNDGFVQDYNTTQDQYLSLPKTPAIYDDDYTATTDIKDLSDRGLSFTLKISGRDYSVTEPSHVCQLITTLNKTGGKLDV